MKSEGRRNWRLIGRMRAMMIKAQKAVLTIGPGEGIIQREKMASMIRTRYWPS